MLKNSGNDAIARDLQTLFDVGTVGGLSDGQLLARFVAGREEAVFDAIVHRHGAMVWGVCRRILRDHHDAEDAFQTTFLVLARKAASVVPRENLANWLHGVAHRTALKARATRAKRRVREARCRTCRSPRPGHKAIRDGLNEWLDRELNRLPEKYRIPIVLCELVGKSHREASSNSAGRSGRSRDGCPGPGRCWRRGWPGGACRSRPGGWRRCWLGSRPAGMPAGWSVLRFGPRACSRRGGRRRWRGRSLPGSPP